MSFHGIDFERIELKKPIILSFDLLSTNYVGIRFLKEGKSAMLRVMRKYTTSPIKNILIKGEKLKRDYLIGRASLNRWR